jgi:hypothetical protein
VCLVRVSHVVTNCLAYANLFERLDTFLFETPIAPDHYSLGATVRSGVQNGSKTVFPGLNHVAALLKFCGADLFQAL